MPRITETIGGVERTFAPLKFKELRELRKMKETSDGFERLDQWTPFLKSSIERAGGSMPDFEEMDADICGQVFAEFILCVMKASGVDAEAKGEAQPVVASL